MFLMHFPFRKDHFIRLRFLLAKTEVGIEATNIETCKLLTMHGRFHPKSSTLTLCAKWNEES